MMANARAEGSFTTPVPTVGVFFRYIYRVENKRMAEIAQVLFATYDVNMLLLERHVRDAVVQRLIREAQNHLITVQQSAEIIYREMRNNTAENAGS